MTCFTSVCDVNRYSRIDVSAPRTLRRVDVADHGSETDPKVRIVVRRGAIVSGASCAVSRVRQAAYVDARPSSHCLAGSSGTGSVSMCQVPMTVVVLGRGATWRSWPRRHWTKWDRGDLCPRYTDCQQLRDECRPATVYVVQYCIPVVLYTILYYYTTIISSLLGPRPDTASGPADPSPDSHRDRHYTTILPVSDDPARSGLPGRAST